MERGQRRWVRRAGGKTAGEGEKKEMHLICLPSPCCVGFSRMCRVFLFFSRTRLCTQSCEGCWLTANSNCPEAIASHFQTGSFIFPWKRKWSLAQILNHPPATVYKVIRETLWQTDSHTYMFVHTQTEELQDWGGCKVWRSRDERQVERYMWGTQTRDGRKFLCSLQVLKGNVSSDYSSELWFVLPFVVLPSKRKWGIHVDVVVSCAESRDQRRGREKMRARGERRRRGGGGSGQERNRKESISPRIIRHWQRLVL